MTAGDVNLLNCKLYEHSFVLLHYGSLFHFLNSLLSRYWLDVAIIYSFFLDVSPALINLQQTSALNWWCRKSCCLSNMTCSQTRHRVASFDIIPLVLFSILASKVIFRKICCNKGKGDKKERKTRLSIFFLLFWIVALGGAGVGGRNWSFGIL